MKRREFLTTMGLCAAGTGAATARTLGFAAESSPPLPSVPAGAPAIAQPPAMKITDVKTFLVGPQLFVKVYTDAGLTGLGEGSLSGRSATVAQAVQEQQRLLVGRDPRDIELLWQQMARWPRHRGGPILSAAVSALDIALWDILGKSLNVPIWRLLGGAARRRIRLYVHVYGTTRQAIAEKVQAAKEQGFTAVRSGLAFLQGRVVKRPWDLKKAVALVEAMREAAGDQVDIMDDAHGMLTSTMVLEYAKAIEKYRLLMLEDPVQPDDLEGLKWIGQHTTVPLGIGESLYGKTAFRPIVFGRLASYVRPDIILAGGLTECRKIAAMAEANFIDVALHVAPSPVSNLAAAHLAAATTNCVLVENTRRRTKPAARDDLFMGGDIQIQEGYALLPDKPGLGCDLDEQAAAKIPPRPNDPPRLEYDDGSVSDW